MIVCLTQRGRCSCNVLGLIGPCNVRSNPLVRSIFEEIESRTICASTKKPFISLFALTEGISPIVRTQDLIGLSETKDKPILLHQLPVLLRPFSLHLDKVKVLREGSSRRAALATDLTWTMY